MDKRVFITSMTSIQSMVLNIDSAAKSLATKPGTSEDEKKAAAEAKANVDLADSIMVQTEKAFGLIEKSMVAFFKANNKEKYTPAKYDEISPVFRKKNVVSGDAETLKSNIQIVCDQMVSELGNNSDAKVYHDNGSVWVKTKTDSKRFETMLAAAKKISSIV